MLCSDKHFLIKPKMLKYIKESTNKAVERHLNNNINAQILKDKPPNCIMMLPFVSLISFLAGYNLHLFFTKNKER